MKLLSTNQGWDTQPHDYQVNAQPMNQFMFLVIILTYLRLYHHAPWLSIHVKQ